MPFSSDSTLFQSNDRKYSFDELINSLPNVHFSTNKYELDRHGRGESYHACLLPNIIAYPSIIGEIQTIVKYCVSRRIPIIPYGAGTSVEGHVTPLKGGLSLDMMNFQSITFSGESNGCNATTTDLLAIVGAGVTRKQLNEHLKSTGYQFVVDPGANATIGGMFSTCASGTTTVKYGTMRNNVLAATCVLPDDDATMVKVGSQALKNAAGYDLLSLLCGSEGTLGIVTDVTVKLHPIQQFVVSAVSVFHTLHEAAQAVSTMKLYDLSLVRCELLDSTSVEAFNSYNLSTENFQPMIVKPTLFLEFEGSTSESALNEQVMQAENVCMNDCNGRSFQAASKESERNVLWAARHQLYYAAIAYRKGATSAIVTDACVPLSQFSNVLLETAQDVENAGVVGPCFGHAGDGNLHCILPTCDDDTIEYRNKLHGVANRLMDRTLAVGGTCTGEHGIGYGKIGYLQKQYEDSGTLHLMKIIKRAIDPYNIMNPGKVIAYDD